MRTILVLVAGAAVLLLLCSCSLLSSHSEPVRQVFAQMLAAGQLTQEQYDALMSALTAGDWDQVWQLVLTAGGSVLSAWLGVPWIANLARGKVTARKGLPPKSS